MSKCVEMFFLGGTISMSSSSGSAVRPTLTGNDIIAAVPALADLDVELRAHTVAREQSGSLTFELLLRVLEMVRMSEADGFVLVQGTDTLEESAYFLDLLYKGEHPFIVTGAMRHPTMAGADGAANILTSVIAAMSNETRDMGVLVAFADELHAARFVRKSDTTSLTTFTSPNTGPVGRVLEGYAHLLTRVDRFPALLQPHVVTHEYPIVHVGLGQSEKAFRAVVEVSDGVVVAGLGAGHMPAWWTHVVDEYIRRKSFIIASRTFSGPALTETYGAIGAEVDLQRRGAVMAGYLSPLQARLIMNIVMSTTQDRLAAETAVAARGQFARRVTLTRD